MRAVDSKERCAWHTLEFTYHLVFTDVQTTIEIVGGIGAVEILGNLDCLLESIV
jgi:hypothetical protein